MTQGILQGLSIGSQLGENIFGPLQKRRLLQLQQDAELARQKELAQFNQGLAQDEEGRKAGLTLKAIQSLQGQYDDLGTEYRNSLSSPGEIIPVGQQTASGFTPYSLVNPSQNNKFKSLNEGIRDEKVSQLMAVAPDSNPLEVKNLVEKRLPIKDKRPGLSNLPMPYIPKTEEEVQGLIASGAIGNVMKDAQDFLPAIKAGLALPKNQQEIYFAQLGAGSKNPYAAINQQALNPYRIANINSQIENRNIDNTREDNKFAFQQARQAYIEKITDRKLSEVERHNAAADAISSGHLSLQEANALYNQQPTYSETTINPVTGNKQTVTSKGNKPSQKPVINFNYNPQLKR